MQIVFVVGTRPDIIKMSAVIKRMLDALVLHTGQHYSPLLSEAFLIWFGIKVNRVLVPGHHTSVEVMFNPLSRATEEWCLAQKSRGILGLWGYAVGLSSRYRG